MTLPPCGGEYAALPYRDEAYPATLDEIEAHFVHAAPEPTRDRRSLIMAALRLQVGIVRRLATKHGAHLHIFLDGGFVTWKERAPRDADLVVFVPAEVYPEFVKPSMLPLWTLSEVGATLGAGDGEVTVDILRPGFGLTDCYVNSDGVLNRRKWHRTWTAARDLTTDKIITGPHKGYIEVVNR